MKKTTQKLKTFLSAHKILSFIGLIVVLGGGYYTYHKFTSTANDIRYVTAKVERGTLVVPVSGTGQVSSLGQVDIKSKTSGDVVYVAPKDGTKVTAGTLIVELDSSDASKAVRDAEINLENAKLSLQKFNVQNSNDNLNADLIKAYDDGFSKVSDAFLDFPGIVTGLKNILDDKSVGDDVASRSGKTARDYRDEAEKAYYIADKALEDNTNEYRALTRISPKEDIEKLINDTYNTTKIISDAIKDLRNYVDFIDKEDEENNPDITSLQSTLSTYTTTINTHLSDLLSAGTTIKNDKDAFQNSGLDAKSMELSVEQKENALQDAKDKLADYFIRAPFDGTLAQINVKKADTISSSTVVTTIITKTELAEISLNEVDVAKIKIGQKAKLTFDAIPGLTIEGTVEDIDTIGTVSQGVVTYLVKVSFDTEDTRVKSAMSVSADIITDQKENTLIVPNSAVKSQGGKSYVEILDSSQNIVEKIPVEVGASNDTQSEVLSGIQEGDEIIVRTILPSTTTSAAPSIFGGGGGTRTGGGGTGGNNVRFQTR